MPDKDINELAEWDKLTNEWQEALTAAEEAQEVMDVEMRDSLLGKGVAPSKHILDLVDDLWHQECEKRGQLDEFISDRFA